MKTSLTGIKPTGTPHLGNYLGAIRPALELAHTYNSFYFIADYHALTTVRDPDVLAGYVYDVAATWLACGLDPTKTFFYRQSAVPEVFELMWVLACLLATGQLERGHAYKDALDKGEAPNAGVFNYPVLMAADIILYDCHVVPVGKDQKQHVELARDVAVRFNHVFGENTLVVPEPQISEELFVPGTDGRKMSKSYQNTLPLFAPSADLKSMVMKIKTGSEPLDAPKDPDSAIVFQLYQQVATAEEIERMAASLRQGGYGWGHAKLALFEALDRELGPKRAAYDELRSDEAKLDAILAEGARRAQSVARATLRRVRQAIGMEHAQGD
jgi:tryptophanyl-tRNA synthetase